MPKQLSFFKTLASVRRVRDTCVLPLPNSVLGLSDGLKDEPKVSDAFSSHTDHRRPSRSIRQMASV